MKEMASITLLSIPLFHPEGGCDRAIARRPGLVFGSAMPGCIACPATWASQRVRLRAVRAMAGSSPATCSRSVRAGHPRNWQRGYSGGFAAGIIAPAERSDPVAAVDHHDPVRGCGQKSLGRLFLAGIGPGFLLVTLVRRLCGLTLSPGI